MWSWLGRVAGGSDEDRRALDEEMAFHRETLTVREERGQLPWAETVRNLRFAFRQIVRDPVFGATCILTTGLIIALGALAWGVADTALWRGLPYPGADRLVHVSTYDASSGSSPASVGVDGSTWLQLRDAGPDWPMAVYSGWTSGVNLSTDQGAARVDAQRVGAGWFGTLGVAPARGREFLPAEDVPEGPALAILSHDLWTTTFAADPEILGGTIRLKGEPHTVIGVMPETFRAVSGADLWTPLRPDPLGEGSGTNYTIVARIPEGVSLAEAGAALRSVPTPAEWVEREGEWRFGATSMAEHDRLQRAGPVRILLGGIALMLLIGWGNLAGLHIARTLGRERELATRRALGGDGAALGRQMVAEMSMIGGIGALVGLVALAVAAPVVEGALRTRFGTWQSFPDLAALAAVGLGFAGVSVLASGIWPVLRTIRSGSTQIGISGSRVRGGKHLGRKVLLVGQLAAVTVLVFSAGLLTRSYAHLEGLDPGFDPTGVHVAGFSLDDARYAEAEVARTLFRTTLERLEARPEVASAALALTLPYERSLNMPFRLPGQEENLLSNVVYVTPGFFETIGIPVLRGRPLTDLDGPDQERVFVVDQAFVDRYLTGEDPLGARIQLGYGIGEASVVGVVGNVQQAAGWGDGPTPVWETPTLYLAADQMPSGFLQGIHVWFAPTWLVRGRAAGAPLAGVITEVFRAVAPELPAARSTTLSAVVDQAFARQRLEAGFLLVMAFFAMLLAGIGLYGLVSQEVIERRGEMGIRMALGASPSQAVVRTGGRGVRLALLGLAIGMALSVPAARLLESLVYGVGAWDPATLAIVVGSLGLLAVVASFVPAVRMGRLDPARILRSEG